MQASDLAMLMPGCCAEVLDAMYFTTVHDAMQDQNEPCEAPGDYAFALAFKGELRGRFGLHMAASTALTLAANFLGEDESELVPSEVGEVIGELANMLCGSVLSKVVLGGGQGKRHFALAHPELCFSRPAAEFDVRYVQLDTDGGVITTWVSVEPNSVIVGPNVCAA